MSRFPFPLGAGVFADESRLEDAENLVRRLGGRGGLPDDELSLVRRTDRVIARGIATASLYTDRVLEQIFPGSSDPADLLPDWEAWYGLHPGGGATVEERQAAVAGKYADHGGVQSREGEGGGRGADVVYFLEEIVGKGNVRYRYNKAAALAAGGYDPHGIYAVAFEVPLAAIRTLGQIETLREIVERVKPAHVGAAVTRAVNHGFLADDPDSLTDRDVVRI